MAYRSVLRSRERGAPGWGGDVKRSKPFIRSRWTSVKGNTWAAKWNLLPTGNGNAGVGGPRTPGPGLGQPQKVSPARGPQSPLWRRKGGRQKSLGFLPILKYKVGVRLRLQGATVSI